jgi:hypothetical protein
MAEYTFKRFQAEYPDDASTYAAFTTRIRLRAIGLLKRAIKGTHVHISSKVRSG